MSESASNAEQIASWNGEVGAKWVKAQRNLDAMLAGVTAELLAAARVAPGERVLDAGCGCGDTSLQLAAKAAYVLGVDVSAPMIAQAKSAATASSIKNAGFILADASEHRFDGSFDVLFSRFGVMFFADPAAAFANLRTALKPGGRLIFVCWRDWRENEWVRETVGAVRPHAPPQPPMAPDAPGPFAFGESARIHRILSDAGFNNVATRPFDAQLPFGGNVDEAVSHTLAFGPVSRMLTGATDEQKALASDALRAALKPFARDKTVKMGGAVWIVTAKT